MNSTIFVNCGFSYELGVLVARNSHISRDPLILQTKKEC